MPTARGFPRFLPRPAELQIVFGKPDALTLDLDACRELWKHSLRTSPLNEARALHAELTAIVERGLDSLGNRLG